MMNCRDQASSAYSGVTCARLNLAGNFPVCIDRLASLAMAGEKTSAHDFSSEHGNTSSGDDLDGMADRQQPTNLLGRYGLE